MHIQLFENYHRRKIYSFSSSLFSSDREVYMHRNNNVTGEKLNTVPYKIENYSKMNVTFADRCIIVSDFITLLSETNIFLDFVPTFEYWWGKSVHIGKHTNNFLTIYYYMYVYIWHRFSVKRSHCIGLTYLQNVFTKFYWIALSLPLLPHSSYSISFNIFEIKTWISNFIKFVMELRISTLF